MKGTPKLIVVTAVGMTLAVIAAEFLMNKTELGKFVG